MPNYIDFGILKEGNTYSFNIAIKNVGVDSCRYKIRPPPPSTGLRLVYVPGPVSSTLNHSKHNACFPAKTISRSACMTEYFRLFKLQNIKGYVT